MLQIPYNYHTDISFNGKLEEATAKAAGALLGKCAINPGAVDAGAIDAAVAEGALRRGDAIVSGNTDHLRALADGVNRKLDVIAV